MLKKLLNRERGFTIIEVMIVLAIAGLIMVIVFIAVPQLQSNARDTRRRDLVSRVKAEMETYANNNGGIYPLNPTGSGTGTVTDFYTRYINGKVDIKDPGSGNDIGVGTGGNYVAYSSTVTLPANPGDFQVVRGAKCNGEGVQASGTNTGTNTRVFAVLIGLDRAGTRFCVDNG